MTSQKRAITILLAAVLALSILLTACGKSGDTPAGDNTGTFSAPSSENNTTPGTSTPDGGQNASGSPEGNALVPGVTVLTEEQAAGISVDNGYFDEGGGMLTAVDTAKSVLEKDQIYIFPPTQYENNGKAFRVTGFTDEGGNRVCQYEIPHTSEVLEAMFPSWGLTGAGSGPPTVLNYDLGTVDYTFQSGAQGSINYNGAAISGSSGSINYGNPYMGSDAPEGTVTSDTGTDISGSLSIGNMNLNVEIYRQGMPGRENTWNEIKVNFSGDIQMTASTSDNGAFGERLYSVPLLTTEEGFVIRLLVDAGASGTKCVSGGTGSMTMQANIEIGVRVGAGPDDDGIPAFTQGGDVSFNEPASAFTLDVGGVLIFEYQGVPLYDICFAVFAVQDGNEHVEIDETYKAYSWAADYHLRKGLSYQGGYNFGGDYILWQEVIFDRWGNGETGSGTYNYPNGAAMSTPSGMAVWGSQGPGYYGPG